mmetsp:Transcript_5937/g.11219  ORF Transcript_5937/g.11219 Transcript_5937/m.11219 type:complete len:138 (-) Transcript_5937:1247-1660(-)
MDQCVIILRKKKCIEMNQRRMWHCLHTFSARLVLEVFGGGGAIWGFSEVLGLRKDSTLWFWRPCALGVTILFFVRWIMQIQEYLEEFRMVDRLGDCEEQVSIAAATIASENHDLALRSNLTSPTSTLEDEIEKLENA